MRVRARQEKVRSQATLSTAARCILEAMEKMSSPLMVNSTSFNLFLLHVFIKLSKCAIKG